MAAPRSAGELGDLGDELHELMRSQFEQGVRFRYLGGNGAVQVARREDFESWARQGLLTGGAAAALPPIEFQPNLADGGHHSYWSLMPHSGIAHWRAGGASAASQAAAGEVGGGSVC